MGKLLFALLLLITAPTSGIAADRGRSSNENRSRSVTEDFQRQNPCPSTGRRSGACPGWVKDHVVPLCAGGPDAVSNMQWQTVENAASKDRLERAVCSAGRAQPQPSVRRTSRPPPQTTSSGVTILRGR